MVVYPVPAAVTTNMRGRLSTFVYYLFAGSPYAIDIKASHAVGDVKVWGPGIENGIIPGFQSHFWVDATGAGAGELRVRIIGPKGGYSRQEGRKEGSVLLNDALNTFYLRLYGVRHLAKNPSTSKREREREICFI